jgi:hypothetical protein
LICRQGRSPFWNATASSLSDLSESWPIML